MTKTLYGTALVLMLAGAASPVLAQSASDWSGPYIGVFGGLTQPDDADDETLLFDRNLDGAFGETVTTSAGANAFSPGFCSGAPNSPAAADGCEEDDDGSKFGARLGYDWQSGPWVFGVVGEVSFTDAEDRVTGFSTTPASYTFNRSLEHVAALRGRIGWGGDRALFYVTGGPAFGKLENGFTTSNTLNSFTTTSDDDKADGYQLGGGIEFALSPRLSLTGEYLHTSLDTEDHVIRVERGAAMATNPFVLAPNTSGTDMIRSSDSFEFNAIRIGLNLRF
jgi:outer membrane immunogenic protein